MTIEEQAYAAIEALREIANPIEFMIRRLKDDERLDGCAAHRLAEDHYYLKQIATDCLHKIASSESNP